MSYADQDDEMLGNAFDISWLKDAVTPFLLHTFTVPPSVQVEEIALDLKR